MSTHTIGDILIFSLLAVTAFAHFMVWRERRAAAVNSGGGVVDLYVASLDWMGVREFHPTPFDREAAAPFYPEAKRDAVLAGDHDRDKFVQIAIATRVRLQSGI